MAGPHQRHAAQWFASCTILFVFGWPFVIIGWRVTAGLFFALGLICAVLGVVELRWGTRKVAAQALDAALAAEERNFERRYGSRPDRVPVEDEPPEHPEP